MMEMTDVGEPSPASFRHLAGEDIARILSPPLRVAILNRRPVINGIVERVATSLGAQLRISHDEAEVAGRLGPWAQWSFTQLGANQWATFGPQMGQNWATKQNANLSVGVPCIASL
jgi:hypothetical protein